MYQTKTQIKLGANRPAKESSTASHSHGRHGPGSGGPGAKDKFDFNIFKALTGPAEPVVDEMAYRKSARIIVTIDIAFSTFLLVAHLITLVSGAAHESTKRPSETPATTLKKKDLIDLHSENPEEALSRKQRETLAVLVWMGLFAVCILQLLVAGGTLGGTYERDGRKTIRNCKIWLLTTFFLVLLVLIQLIAVLVFGSWEHHYVAIALLVGEIAFRIIGLFIVSKFIKELSFEFADDGEFDMEDRIYYEKLASCPSPNPTQSTHHV